MINNPEKFLSGFWDWDFLLPVFEGTNIKVSDIDGMIERNGEILLIETKGSEVQTIPTGQKIAFESFAKKGIFIIVLFGEKNNPIRMQKFSKTLPSGGNIEKCNEKDVLGVISKWFKYANSK